MIERMVTRLLALALSLGCILVDAAPLWAGSWKQELIRRPAEDGGDVRYAILYEAGNSTLQIGCTANRIERVLIVFPLKDGVTAPIAQQPEASYAFDDEDAKATDWPLFEPGTVAVPRGSQSSRITRKIGDAQRLRVTAKGYGGAPLTASFDLSGAGPVVDSLLGDCGIR